MDRILRVLLKKDNALLESPTGSGKTLAVLCACLAWQQRMKEMLLAEEAPEEEILEDNDEAPNAPHGDCDEESEADDDFVATRGRTKPRKKANKASKPKARKEPAEETKKRPRVPKIFYVSRTHSQIAQVVRELRRINYRPRMCILGSRELSCVHPQVSKRPNKNAECLRLMENRSCRYHHGAAMLAQEPEYREGVWDLEDLIEAGKQAKACPYYAARELQGDAEIVFAPYNYVLDPAVRSALEIRIARSIVVFDEAHNIEDVCRDAASTSVSMRDLRQTADDLGAIASRADPELQEAAHTLFRLVEGISEWASSQADRLGDHTPHLEFPGVEAVAVLERSGFPPGEAEHLRKCLEECSSKHGPKERNQRWRRDRDELSPLAHHVLQSLITTGELLHSDNLRSAACFSLALARSGGGGGGGYRFNEPTVQIHFWCMSPAVAFRALKEARSVILTSGTLSPMDSFASELATEFKIQVEAPHVVDTAKQVFVAAVSRSPSGTVLNTSYQQAQQTTVQDGVGELIASMLACIPHGVLVFFPSYRMLDKFIARWDDTGHRQTLERIKPMFVEPQGQGSGGRLEVILRNYQRSIAEGNGAALFAVCRGKVSEGLDFSDDTARGVIVVGIPYPAFKDHQVKLKRSFNDQLRNTRAALGHGGAASPNATPEVASMLALAGPSASQESSAAEIALPLSGEDWYRLQAFRALNQAVGRCIRHRADYGSVILVDERFQSRATAQKLSKWLRPCVRNYSISASLPEDLRGFFAEREAESADVPCTPPSASTSAASAETTPGVSPDASPVRSSDNGGPSLDLNASASAVATPTPSGPPAPLTPFVPASQLSSASPSVIPQTPSPSRAHTQGAHATATPVPVPLPASASAPVTSPLFAHTGPNDALGLQRQLRQRLARSSPPVPLHETPSAALAAASADPTDTECLETESAAAVPPEPETEELPSLSPVGGDGAQAAAEARPVPPFPACAPSPPTTDAPPFRSLAARLNAGTRFRLASKRRSPVPQAAADGLTGNHPVPAPTPESDKAEPREHDTSSTQTQAPATRSPPSAPPHTGPSGAVPEHPPPFCAPSGSTTAVHASLRCRACRAALVDATFLDTCRADLPALSFFLAVLAPTRLPDLARLFAPHRDIQAGPAAPLLLACLPRGADQAALARYKPPVPSDRPPPDGAWSTRDRVVYGSLACPQCGGWIGLDVLAAGAPPQRGTPPQEDTDARYRGVPVDFLASLDLASLRLLAPHCVELSARGADEPEPVEDPQWAVLPTTWPPSSEPDAPPAALVSAPTLSWRSLSPPQSDSALALDTLRILATAPPPVFLAHPPRLSHSADPICCAALAVVSHPGEPSLLALGLVELRGVFGKILTSVFLGAAPPPDKHPCLPEAVLWAGPQRAPPPRSALDALSTLAAAGVHGVLLSERGAVFALLDAICRILADAAESPLGTVFGGLCELLLGPRVLDLQAWAHSYLGIDDLSGALDALRTRVPSASAASPFTPELAEPKPGSPPSWRAIAALVRATQGALLADLGAVIEGPLLHASPSLRPSALLAGWRALGPHAPSVDAAKREAETDPTSAVKVKAEAEMASPSSQARPQRPTSPVLAPEKRAGTLAPKTTRPAPTQPLQGLKRPTEARQTQLRALGTKRPADPSLGATHPAESPARTKRESPTQSAGTKRPATRTPPKGTQKPRRESPAREVKPAPRKRTMIEDDDDEDEEDFEPPPAPAPAPPRTRTLQPLAPKTAVAPGGSQAAQPRTATAPTAKPETACAPTRPSGGPTRKQLVRELLESEAVCCIVLTGVIQEFSREELLQLAADARISIRPVIGKRTRFAVVGDNPTPGRLELIHKHKLHKLSGTEFLKFITARKRALTKRRASAAPT